MKQEWFEMGQKLFGVERPPQRVRHFLPPLDRASGWAFEGYQRAKRYSIGYCAGGDCLAPDFPVGPSVFAFDPQLPVRHGDIGALVIRVPGMEPQHCLKQIQVRDGKPWACCNDGDMPLSGFQLSEHIHLQGRVVYHQGLSNLFAALHDANVKGPGNAALLSEVGSLVPGAVSFAARLDDPYQREVYNMLDEFKSKIPGLSKTLPPRRDLWGNPRPSHIDSQVTVSDEQHTPIDDEIIRQGFNIQMPEATQSFGTRGNMAAINMRKYPEAYSRMVELAGHALQHPAYGMGAQDLLNAIVSGSHPLSAVYNLKSDGPGGGKEMMIRDLMTQYRDLAKTQVLKEYPALQQDVSDKAQALRALKLGPMGR